MPTQLLYLLRVKGIDTTIRESIENAFDQSYDSDLGYGFSSVRPIESDTVRGTFIFSSVSSNKVFDTVSNSLRADTQIIFQEAQFEFDLENGIVAIRGGGNKLRKFINTIGTIAGNKISVDTVSVDIIKAVQFLQENCSVFELTGLLIRNYKPNQYLTGRFAARVYSTPAARDILTNYGADVAEFTSTLEIEDEEIKIRMSQVGAVAISSTELGVRKGLDLIKEMALEKSHA